MPAECALTASAICWGELGRRAVPTPGWRDVLRPSAQIAVMPAVCAPMGLSSAGGLTMMTRHLLPGESAPRSLLLPWAPDIRARSARTARSSAGARATTRQASPPGGERYVDGPTVPVAGRLIDISTGTYHGCGLRPDGAAACWGSDWHGESSPPEGESFTSISSGGGHTCALRSDGTPICWGRNDYGESSPAARSVAEIGQQRRTTYLWIEK